MVRIFPRASREERETLKAQIPLLMASCGLTRATVERINCEVVCGPPEDHPCPETDRICWRLPLQTGSRRD